MKLQAINNQIFGAKFRVKVNNIIEPRGEQIVTTTVFREYPHPQAEEIYKKASAEKDIYKKEQLIKQMGMADRIEEVSVMDRLLPEIRTLFSKDKK